MDLITQEEFTNLIRYEDDSCISIFIPTHKSGEETLTGKDAKKLKNQIKNIRHTLEKRDWDGLKIKKFLKPATDLLNDSTFWRYNAEGIAIYLATDYQRIYRVPISFEAQHYISNEFYINPLLPLFTDDGSFYIISLGLKGIKLYEGTKHSISQLDVEELVPSRLEDTVGYDWEQSMIQFRTQKGSTVGKRGGEGAIFHGHAGDKADDDAEISRFLHEVDKEIMKRISDKLNPLLVASIDYMFPIYKKANTYPHLWDEHISGNPADKNESDLHEQSIAILKPYFEKEKNEKLKLFHQFKSTDKASSDLKSIVPAAINGRIDTLFVQKNAEAFGTFNKSENSISVAENHQIAKNVSLLNLAASQTILHGGKVYLMEEEKMPEEWSKLCGYYRY